MTVVKGDIRLVTNEPAAVSQVWVRAPKPRTQGLAYVSESSDTVQVDNGVVEFTAFPGAAVMVLVQNGVPTDTVKLIVPDKETASLRECIDAVGLVDDGTLNTLELLALDVAENIARIGGASQIDQWVEEVQAAQQAAGASADKAENEADRSESKANDSATSANASKQDADRSEREADRSKDEADRSEQADGRSEAGADRSETAAQASESSATRSENAADRSVGIAASVNTMRTETRGQADRAEQEADRAEYWAEETVQQVTGDFATKNYVDNQAGDKFVGYSGYAKTLLRTDENGKLVVSTGTITGAQDVVNKAYVDSASFARGTLTASDDLDAMADKKYAGAWQVTSTPVAESLGVPSPGYGTLIVFWAAGSSEPYYTATQWWVPAASGDMFKRSIVSRGSWSSWSLIGGTSGNGGGATEQTAAISASTGRANLLAASRGGRIGTGGKAVVSLRFDHNMGAFDTNILPLLRNRRLPATLACYYDMISPVPGYSNDDSRAANKSWTHVEQAFYRGIEIFSHSYSHQDASNLDKIRHEIVDSRTALESAMPDVRVHGWAMPGIGGSQYMGWWDAWVDPETRLPHPAAQILGATYGTYNVSGYGLNELGKTQTRYFGVESHTTAATSKGHIDRAIATGTGVTLMWHPNQIGADGKMSLAVFEEILDYIVQKRDAGEIMVLTMGGQAVADPSTEWRHSLVPNVAGWSGSPTGTLTYDLGLYYLHDSTGVVREFEVEVEGTGNIRLTAQDPNSDVFMNVYQTLSFSGGGTARISVGIPRRASTLRLTAECNGLTIKNIGLYAI